MIINKRIFVIFMCIFFSAISCTEKSSQSAFDYSDSLIVLENASNIKYTKLNGIDQISYKLIEQYPANEAISELNKRLKDKNWKPLKRSWLNPGILTSHERGWTNFIDGTKNPNLEVHSWNSDWINEKEDIMTFSLNYGYPVKTKSNMLELKVIGIYISEEVAKMQVEQINEYKKSIVGK